MNDAHLHLVVNHLPIIFPVVGIILLIIGIFTQSTVTKRNSYIIFVLGALASIAAMATGEGAEEAVENIQGVSEALIHDHEEAAELFAGLSYALGGFSILGIFAGYKNFSWEKIVSFGVLILCAITLYFAQEAGRTGGEIRHTEIRNGISAQNNGEQNNSENRAENGGEEDDD